MSSAISDTSASRGRRAAWNFLRAGVGFLLAGWLIRSVIRSSGVNLVALYRACNPWWLVAAQLCYAAGYPLLVWRWRRLLSVAGVHLSWRMTFRLVMIAGFFNMFVPGALGGDLAKASVLARETPGRRVESLLTIFVDRLLGVLGLVVLTAISMVCGIGFLNHADPRLRLAALVFGVTVFAVVAAVVAVAFRGRLGRIVWIRGGVQACLRVTPPRVRAVVYRVTGALDAYRECPSVLMWGTAVSVVIHLLATATVLCLARAVGEHHLSVVEYLVAVQMANAAGALPLTPGGLGGRDVVMLLVFVAAGASRALSGAIPVLYSANIAVWSLLGGVVFVFDPVRAEMREASSAGE